MYMREIHAEKNPKEFTLINKYVYVVVTVNKLLRVV